MAKLSQQVSEAKMHYGIHVLFKIDFTRILQHVQPRPSKGSVNNSGRMRVEQPL
jgi:hypothetical protein